MTEPLSINQKPQVFKGYVQAQGGFASAGADKIALFGVTGGVEARKKGFHAGAEVGVGTMFQAKAEIGKEFSIGKNMGLDLSGKAEYKQSLLGTSSEIYEYSSNNDVAVMLENGQNVNYSLSTPAIAANIWTPGETRFAGSAKLKYEKKNVNIGVGVEGGYRANNAPNTKLNFSSNQTINVSKDGETKTYDYSTQATIGKNKHMSGAYITPTVSAEVKAGKHISFTANADMYQGQAGIKYTF